MKKTASCILLCLLILLIAGGALSATSMSPYKLSSINFEIAFPSGWKVATPDSVEKVIEHMAVSDMQIAAKMLEDEDIAAISYSDDGMLCLRIMVEKDDETAQIYWDIERYTQQMRTAIKNDFLDKQAWSLVGFRCSEAEWTNKANQGRLLRMTYTIRFADETAARGLRAYTVHNGMVFTLDIQRYDGPLTNADKEIFEAFVKAAQYPASTNMPLLPVGLSMKNPIPNELDDLSMTLKGTSQKGATITAEAISDDGTFVEIGGTIANNNGEFKLDTLFPEEGIWTVTVTASADEFAPSMISGSVDIDVDRLPVSFTSLPEGDVYDKKIVVSGTAPSGTEIQCLEGTSNTTKRVGSDGIFSFILDSTQTGERTVTLSMNKKNYENRRFTINFNRCWNHDDYIEHLESIRQSLAYEKFVADPERYEGRLVRFRGIVTDISRSNERAYIEIATDVKSDGTPKNKIIACTLDAFELQEGDSVVVYGNVSGETFTFSHMDEEGNTLQEELPSINMLVYDLK